MDKIASFTIVAKNYIGLAQILEKSLGKHNPDVDFYIIVADEFDDTPSDLPSNVLIARDILNYSSEKWEEMSFKYNLTEFCTAIKPGSMKYLFNKGYGKTLYFDPDIYIYSSINRILSILDDKSCIITPQVTGIHKVYKSEHPEWHMNVNGIYNLGFIGLSKSEKTVAMLDWWENHLFDSCFADRLVGEFTDQKWMDWIPAFYGNDVEVSRYLGFNLAPWNFFERKIYKDTQEKFIVTFREEDSNEERHDELIFIHFSGFDYKELKEGRVVHKRMDLKAYPDILEAMEKYGESIKSNQQLFDSYIDQKYSYGQYENGNPIGDFQRHIYNGLVKEGNAIPNPFSTSKGSYYSKLRKAGLISTAPPIKATRRAVENIKGKRRVLNRMFYFLYKLMKRDRYILFVKSLHDYCRPEFHTFLVK